MNEKIEPSTRELYSKYVMELSLTGTTPEDKENVLPNVFPFIPESMFASAIKYPLLNHHLEVFLVNEPCGTCLPLAKDPLKPALPLLDGRAFTSEDDEQSLAMNPNVTLSHIHDTQEIYMFFGTNPEDPMDLGGEIELWLGSGYCAEKKIITKPSVVIVPPGVAHHPMIFKRVDRTIIKVVIYDKPILDSIPIGCNPPAFDAENGIESPGKYKEGYSPKR